MWYTAHLSIPLCNATFTMTVLLCLCLSGDRLLAVAAPIHYKTYNYFNRLLIMVIVSTAIAISVNAWECGEYLVGYSDNSYVIISLVTNVSKYMGRIRIMILILGATLSIICNILLIYFYKRRTNKVTQMISNQMEMERRSQQKTLFIVTAYESAMITFSCVTFSLFYTAIDINWFSACGYFIYQPTLDAGLEIVDLLEFYIIFGFSASFRAIVLEAVPVLRFFSH